MRSLIRYLTSLVLFSAVIVFASTVAAVPNGITLQTKILKPDGSPLEEASVDFRITTLSPLSSCVVYVETFGAINMVGKGGLAILNLGSGSQVYSASGVSYSSIFNNLAPSYTCQAGGVYNSAGSDARKIVIQFNDNTGSGWQTLSAVDINSVPFAYHAGDSAQLAGHPVSDFLIGSTNLSSITSAPTARTNLGSTVTGDAIFTAVTPAAARTTLGLGTSSVLEAGTAANNLVQLDGSAQIPAALLPVSATAWTDLGSGAINHVGAVGVNSAVPSSLLTVDSTGSTGPIITIRNTAGGGSTYPGLDIKKYGGNGIPRIRFFNYTGTLAAPTATAAGTLGSFDFWGYGGSTSYTAASIGISALANFTDTSTPTVMGFSTTSVGSVTSTERLRIDSTGHVGIGTSTPVAKLTVTGATGTSSGTTTLTATSGATTITTSAATTLNIGDYLIPTTTTGQARVVTTAGSGTVFSVSPPFTAPVTAETFTIYPALTSINSTSASNKLYIQGSTGNIGVATRAPRTTLDVSGTINTPLIASRATTVNNTAVGIGFGTLDSASIPITIASVFAAMSSNTTTAVNSYLHFDVLTGGTLSEKVRIDATGKMGVGTTGPTEMLDVVGNIKSSGCIYYASSSTGTCASDERIKKDVHRFNLGLKELLGINPVYFKYNGLAGFANDDRIQLGVIAQQIEKAAPDLIQRQMVQLHENDSEKTEIKVVDYGAFSYVLINSVKQFYKMWAADSAQIHRDIASIKDQEITNLRTENKIMKSRLDDLEKKLSDLKN